jgi:hypothetical protein
MDTSSPLEGMRDSNYGPPEECAIELLNSWSIERLYNKNFLLIIYFPFSFELNGTKVTVNYCERSKEVELLDNYLSKSIDIAFKEIFIEIPLDNVSRLR